MKLVNEDSAYDAGGSGETMGGSAHWKSGPDDDATAPIDSPDKAMWQIEKPEIRERLNIFVQSIVKGKFIDPTSALIHLKSKLNMIGIHFDFQRFSGAIDRTVWYFPLARWGGVMTLQDNQFVTTDGIEMGESVFLRLAIEVGDTGKYLMDGKILTASEAAEEDPNYFIGSN